MNALIKSLNVGVDRRARVISSDNNWLEDSAVEQLRKTMGLTGMRVGVGMPDLHPGKGQPIGATFVTENHIYPHLVGSDIGCGMGFWQLNIPVKRIKLDKWEKKLSGLDELWEGNISQYLSERGVTSDDAFLQDEIVKLGTIGGGNHFAEFQKVNEIFDMDAFNLLNMGHQFVFLLVHSGSRGLGQKILQEHIHKLGAKGINTSNNLDVMLKYLSRHGYAEKWAVVNRELIAERFCEQLNAQKQFLLDVTHNMVEPLSDEQAHLLQLSVTEKRHYWIHRKGASPTDNGFVMIPGSRGSLSYLVRPKVEDDFSLSQSGFSLAHGAGRKWKRADARGKLEHRFKVKDLESTSLGSRVICKQRDLLYEEAPQAYKDISYVINDLVAAGLIEVVATFKPVLTYKTRKV